MTAHPEIRAAFDAFVAKLPDVTRDEVIALCMLSYDRGVLDGGSLARSGARRRRIKLRARLAKRARKVRA